MMDAYELKEMASGLMEELRSHAEDLGLLSEELQEKGTWRITEFANFEAWPDHSHLIDLQSRCSVFIPLPALSSLCEATAWLSFYNGPGAKVTTFLVEAAKRLAFMHGFAVGTVYEDEYRRTELKKNGASGGKRKNEAHAKLRVWALENKGLLDDKKEASRLAEKLPLHLAGVSADPQRFIYDEFRKQSRTRLAS